MNILASLFNLAGSDLVIILLIVLLLFGTKKLPELTRGMGQAVREFSKAKDEFERKVTHPGQEKTLSCRIREGLRGAIRIPSLVFPFFPFSPLSL